MRALILALALAGVASSASAQGSTTTWGSGVRESISPTVPANAVAEAKTALKHDVGDDNPKFRDVRASEVASVRHGAFTEAIAGPVSIICGQYEKAGQPDYDWFFVALKRGRVLWIASAATGQPDEAHASCKNAGLTPDSPPQTGADGPDD